MKKLLEHLRKEAERESSAARMAYRRAKNFDVECNEVIAASAKARAETYEECSRRLLEIIDSASQTL